MSNADAKSIDTLIHARWLLTMRAPREVLEHYSLAIDGARIAAVGPRADLEQRFSAADEFTLDSHAVLPGLINAHGHSPMSLLRGFADDLPLQPWLEEKIWPAEARWMNEEFVQAGARLAIAEMLLSGTTCFTDMYFFPDHVAREATEAGIRAQLAGPVFDFPTVWAQDAEEYISKATRLYDEFRNSDLIRVCFGPHAPYTVSDAPLQKIAMLAEELDIGIHMHIHENAMEVSDAMKLRGMRPLARLKQLELLGPRLQGVHMTQLNPEEIGLLRETGVHAIHCPASNMKLASGFSPVPELLQAGVNVALGTDSCASNNNLDMFIEMRLAALLHKGHGNDASAMPAWQVLQMATLNGARVMGMEDQLGSLEQGKLADIIAVDLDAINTQPVYDPVSALVYSAHSRQVSHSWVNGRLLLRDHELMTFDVDEVLAQAGTWRDRIGGRA